MPTRGCGLGPVPLPSASPGMPPARPLSSRRPPAPSLAALGAPRGDEGSGAGPARPCPFRAGNGCRRAGPSEGAAEDGGQAIGPTSARLFLASVPPPRAAPFPTLPRPPPPSSPGRGAAAAARAEPGSCALSRQESGKMAGAEAGMSGAGIQQQSQQQPQHPAAAAAAADESSDSEGEHEGPQKLIRKVSTSGQIRSKVSGEGTGARRLRPGTRRRGPRSHPAAPRLRGGSRASSFLPSPPPVQLLRPHLSPLAGSPPGRRGRRGSRLPVAGSRPALPASWVWGKQPPSAPLPQPHPARPRSLLLPRPRGAPRGVVRPRRWLWVCKAAVKVSGQRVFSAGSGCGAAPVGLLA